MLSLEIGKAISAPRPFPLTSVLRRAVRVSVLLAGVSIPCVAQSAATDSPGLRGPTVAGIILRDSSARVLATLGSPERRTKFFAFRVWEYSRRGITLMWSEDDDELRVIILGKPSADDVDGVRVGDRLAVAKARWGAPARSRQDGRYIDFVRAAWVLSVEVANQRINEITLMVLGNPLRPASLRVPRFWGVDEHSAFLITRIIVDGGDANAQQPEEHP
jgi:hypothetical protein